MGRARARGTRQARRCRYFSFSSMAFYSWVVPASLCLSYLKLSRRMLKVNQLLVDNAVTLPFFGRVAATLYYEHSTLRTELQVPEFGELYSDTCFYRTPATEILLKSGDSTCLELVEPARNYIPFFLLPYAQLEQTIVTTAGCCVVCSRFPTTFRNLFSPVLLSSSLFLTRSQSIQTTDFLQLHPSLLLTSSPRRTAVNNGPLTGLR